MIQPLNPIQIQQYLKQFNSEWQVINGKKIKREFSFKDFKDAMVFVNKVADLAEAERHHPDINIFYNRVVIELWTHDIGGLSKKDFDLAAKIEVY